MPCPVSGCMATVGGFQLALPIAGVPRTILRALGDLADRHRMLRESLTWILRSRASSWLGLTPSIGRGDVEEDGAGRLRRERDRVAGDVSRAARRWRRYPSASCRYRPRRHARRPWRCRAPSAAICASTVSAPCPVSTVPVSRTAVPSSFIFTVAALGLAATVKPIGYHMQAMPRPRRFMSPALLPAESIRGHLKRFSRRRRCAASGRSG